jgi:hypothetical protein
MTFTTWQAILGMGIFFVLLGIVSVLWSRREQTRYYDSISTRRDVKEFLTREPHRSWLGAWLIGGKLCLVIGIVLLIVSMVIK